MSRLNSFLAGVKVLDLSRHLPGPLATLLLADMGAEVVKVEPPQGDEMRGIGAGARGYRAVNAGKTARRLDLKTGEGREALLRLAAEADVLVESFRPGTLTRLGVGPDRIRSANPRIILCSLSGFGQTGPWRERAGHDIVYLALNGALAAMGGPPVPPYPPPADISAALSAVIAILGALLGRARDGKGCEIDVALADAPLPLLLFSLAELSGQPPFIGGADGILGGGAAYNAVYATKDGQQVALGAIEPKFWRAFCAAAERPDWLPRQDDALPQTALKQEVGALFATMTATEAAARFEPADCCFAVVAPLAEALESPHARARNLVRKGPDGLVQALFPARIDGAEPALRRPLIEPD